MPYSPSNPEICLNNPNRGPRVCTVQHMYKVTPKPCYLLHVGSLVRFGNWFLPSTTQKPNNAMRPREVRLQKEPRG